MTRILTWYAEHPKASGEDEGPVFYADHDYNPGAVRLMAHTAPDLDTKVDILSDGVSIFTSEKATLNRGATLEEHAEDYQSPRLTIAEGAAISFRVIATGGAVGITAQFEMDTIDDDESA